MVDKDGKETERERERKDRKTEEYNLVSKKFPQIWLFMVRHSFATLRFFPQLFGLQNQEISCKDLFNKRVSFLLVTNNPNGGSDLDSTPSRRRTQV